MAVGDTQGPSVSQSSPRGTQHSPFLLHRMVNELESQRTAARNLLCCGVGVGGDVPQEGKEAQAWSSLSQGLARCSGTSPIVNEVATVVAVG